MNRPASPTGPATAAALADAASAEAWDAWFRWRSGTTPRDVVVTDTWQRVAAELATVERDQAWAQSYADALDRLHVLPDARILAGAGCGSTPWPSTGLHAAVNVAAMVRDPFTAQARLDLAALAHGAAVAVRMLDAAALLAREPETGGAVFRIGPIGFADALLMLGLRYDSADACAAAQQIASTLALGCCTESARLAVDRGACDAGRRRAPPALPDDAMRDVALTGLRHAALTAVDRQPRLALLANNVADAIDPLPGAARWLAIDAPDGVRHVRTPGSTWTRYLRLRERGAIAASSADMPGAVPASACEAVRVAMQPWIDARIERMDAAPPATGAMARLHS